MKLISWLSIIILSCFNISCTSDTNDLLRVKKGIVVDYQTRQPIANIKVYLYDTIGTIVFPELWYFGQADTITTSSIPNLTNVADSTITDITGKFQFSYVENIPVRGTRPATISRNDSRIHVGPIFWSQPYPGDTIYTDQKSFLQLNISNAAATANDTLLQWIRFEPIPPTLTANIPGLISFKGQIGRTNSQLTLPFSSLLYKQVVVQSRRYNGGLQSAATDTFDLQPGQNMIDINY